MWWPFWRPFAILLSSGSWNSESIFFCEGILLLSIPKRSLVSIFPTVYDSLDPEDRLGLIDESSLTLGDLAEGESGSLQLPLVLGSGLLLPIRLGCGFAPSFSRDWPLLVLPCPRGTLLFSVSRPLFAYSSFILVGFLIDSYCWRSSSFTW